MVFFFISDFNQSVRTIFVSDDFNTIVILLENKLKKICFEEHSYKISLKKKKKNSSDFWAISFLINSANQTETNILIPMTTFFF